MMYQAQCKGVDNLIAAFASQPDEMMNVMDLGYFSSLIYQIPLHYGHTNMKYSFHAISFQMDVVAGL